MHITSNETTLEAVMSKVASIEESHARKLADLAQANIRLREELDALRTARPSASKPAHPAQEGPSSSFRSSPTPRTAHSTRKSRRNLLRQGLGIAAAVVGAGTLMEVSVEQALASSGPHQHGVHPDDNPGLFTSSDGSTPAVRAYGTNGSKGVYGQSDSDYGVEGQSTSGLGVYGNSSYSIGVQGASVSGTGVYGVTTSSGDGVWGSSYNGSSNGVHGYINGSGSGVLGENGGSGPGVSGSSSSGTGLYGAGGNYGVYAFSTSGIGVYSYSSGTALVVSGHMQLQGDAVGTATLPKGQKVVMVTTPAATASSNIVLTALNSYKGAVWVTRSSGSFTINSSVAQPNNVGFSYLIIN